MDSSSVLAVRALATAADNELARNVLAAQAALRRERANRWWLHNERVRLQSLLRRVSRHLQVGDEFAARDVLQSEQDLFARSDSEDEEEEEDDDDEAAGVRCVVCSTTGHQVYWDMAPEGRWAGLEPGERVVCGFCRSLPGNLREPATQMTA